MAQLTIHGKTVVVAGLLLVSTVLSQTQQPAGGGGLRGPGGPPGGRGGFGGPQLPAEQQALVDQLAKALSAENLAVTAASSNLVTASFSTPKDGAKITEANAALTKARAAWATKATAEFAKIQASETKLSSDAIARLVATASGRGGPPQGFGAGGPGGPRGQGPRGQ